MFSVSCYRLMPDFDMQGCLAVVVDVRCLLLKTMFVKNVCCIAPAITIYTYGCFQSHVLKNKRTKSYAFVVFFYYMYKHFVDTLVD